MECCVCLDIVHPKCFQKHNSDLTSKGVVNEDLPSSWECPKCCEEGKQSQGKVSVRASFFKSKNLYLMDSKLICPSPLSYKGTYNLM